jgi:hypothetical protein
MCVAGGGNEQRGFYRLLGHRDHHNLADDLRADLARHGGVGMSNTEAWLNVHRTALARIRELEAALREIEAFTPEIDGGDPYVQIAVFAKRRARAALNTQTGRVDPAPSSSGPAPTATVNRR